MITNIYCAEVSRVTGATFCPDPERPMKQKAYQYIKYKHTVTFIISGLVGVDVDQSVDMPTSILHVRSTHYSIKNDVTRELRRILLQMNICTKYTILGELYVFNRLSFKEICPRIKPSCPFGCSCNRGNGIFELTFNTYKIRAIEW